MKKNVLKLKKSSLSVVLCASLIGMNACARLDETIYRTIATEKAAVTEEDIQHLVERIHSSLRAVYWSWEGLFDIYKES